MKALVGANMHNNDKRDGQLDTVRSDSWDVNISFTHLIFYW